MSDTTYEVLTELASREGQDALVKALERNSAVQILLNTEKFNLDGTLAEVQDARKLEKGIYLTLGIALRTELPLKADKESLIKAVNRITALEGGKADNDTVTTLQTQVNNLLGSVVEGSTTLDAELIDIRVGYDGTTYQSAGIGLRTMMQAMSDRIAALEALGLGVDAEGYPVQTVKEE